jgi:hypothetical protein
MTRPKSRSSLLNPGDSLFRTTTSAPPALAAAGEFSTGRCTGTCIDRERAAEAYLEIVVRWSAGVRD